MEAMLYGILIAGLVGLWLLPAVLIARDRRIQRKEKAIWIFAMFFVSWAAWILCMFIAPVMDDDLN